MQKYFSILMLLLLCGSIRAQFKFSAAGGINNNLNSQNDSTSFAAPTGTAFSIKPSYHWGRIGISAELGMAKHAGGSIDEIRNRLNVDTGARVNAIEGGGVTTMSALIGPELCVCFKKIRIIPSIRVGVVNTKIEGSFLRLGNAAQGLDRRYALEQQSVTDFATQFGLSVGYKLNPKMAINFNSAITSFVSNVQVLDRRRGIPTTPLSTIKQAYNFLKLATGITYSF